MHINRKSILRVYLPVLLALLVIAYALPRGTKFPYDYKAGRQWQYDNLYAQFDFPLYKSQEQIWAQNSQKSDTPPYYKFSQEQTIRSLRLLEATDLDSLKRAIISSFSSIYERGVLSDADSTSGKLIYLQKDKHATLLPLSELYSQKEARDKLLSTLSELSSDNLDSTLRAAGVYDLFVPNVIYDAQTTELIRAEQSVEVSPTSGYISSGQLLISEGEMVTTEIAAILDAYRKEYEANIGFLGNPLFMWIGNFSLAATILILFLLLVQICCHYIFKDRRFIFVLSVFCLFVTLSLFICRTQESLITLFPFTLVVLMYQAFFKSREYIAIYLLSLFPLLLFAQEGQYYFVMFALAGTAQAFIFKYFRKGWRQFIAASITFGILALQLLGFKAISLFSAPIGASLMSLFVGSFLTVAAYPLIYLFEKIFNLVSDSRLAELCDTSSQLIRQLERKAPGTFQHSLQVMNMADTVARSIGVNPELVRAGALYHDIGKISNPLCFVENEFMISAEDVPKYHSELGALQSAQDIIKHVSDGEEIARKAGLPQAIIDFILSHHGTSSVRYFYSKHLREGGSEEALPEFCYKGKAPKTKAQVVLMLCDSIEAASRTLKTNSAQAYSEFVESIVAGKMAEGQLEQAEISIHELGLLKEALKQYLAQVNHERVVYPKNKR